MEKVTFTVPVLSIIFMIITCLISFGVPLALAIYYRKKLKTHIKPFFVGFGIFIVFALILESMVHVIVLKYTGNVGNSISTNKWLYGLYGGFAAGIFEETGRFMAFKVFLKKHLKRENALMYGAGHGGVEAMIIVGLASISNIIISIAINTGNLENFLGAAATDPVTMNNLSALATTPTFDFLAAGVERIVAITLHICLSVVVYGAVTQKGKVYLFPLAILIHAAINFMAVVLNEAVPVYVVEALLVVAVAVVAVFVRKLYVSLEPVVEE